MKLKFVAEPVQTTYWVPGDDYLAIIGEALKERLDDGDIVAVSEKALSVAKGRIINEGQVKPGIVAKVLAHFWMRIVWGRFLGRVCDLKVENVCRLQNYPLKEGSAHKQVAVWHASFLQSLLWGSEGGIDASNLAYSYVSLPLDKPEETAAEICYYLRNGLGRKVTVMIVDTDKTYSCCGFHFTHRSTQVKDIHTLLGYFSYIAGRALRLRRRSTPLAIAGLRMDVNLALDLAETVHKSRGSGAGLTVWDMAETFGVNITGVTWSMLKDLRHQPIVILRLCRRHYRC